MQRKFLAARWLFLAWVSIAIIIFLSTHNTSEFATSCKTVISPSGLLHHYSSFFTSFSSSSCSSGHVAIGMALTTRGLTQTKEYLINNFLFFSQMLPSLCRTLSQGFCYKIHIGYDFNDPMLSTENQTIFVSLLKEILASHCFVPTDFKLYASNYSMKPAWSQNDVMMAAYNDGFEYFYLVNDDTYFVTPHWTELFVSALNFMTPKNVGAVGPSHRGGNKKILTYHFVHRTHIDIFGFFYPREFPDWYADDWITEVYKPNNSRKIQMIHLNHTKAYGTRYTIHRERKELLSKAVNDSTLFKMGYLRAMKMVYK